MNKKETLIYIIKHDGDCIDVKCKECALKLSCRIKDELFSNEDFYSEACRMYEELYGSGELMELLL